MLLKYTRWVEFIYALTPNGIGSRLNPRPYFSASEVTIQANVQFHPHTYSGLFLPRLVAYTATATEGGTDKPIMAIFPAQVVSMTVMLMVTVNNSLTISTGFSTGCAVMNSAIGRPIV